jgi:hypothetical protein
MKAAIVVLAAMAMVGCTKQQSTTLPQPTGGQPPKPVASLPCAAAPGDQCPPAAWIADLERVRQLQAPYTMPQDTQDLISGVLARLQRDIPAGFQWNESKRAWVKIAPPVPQAPTSQPSKK